MSEAISTSAVRECLIVVMPGVTAEEGAPSILRELEVLPGPILEAGKVARLHPLPDASTTLRETVALGLPPTEVPLRPGPLTVTALATPPPTDCTCFCIAMQGLDVNGRLITPDPPTPAEWRETSEALRAILAKDWHWVEGTGLLHGLVWPGGPQELTDFAPEEVSEHYSGDFPIGDGERRLRQFIDDSVNVLAELECNHVREEEGRIPIGIAWPFGGARRPTLPPLALERGIPAQVLTSNMNLVGLTKLVGYMATDPARMHKGLLPNWRRMSQDRNLSLPALVYADEPAAMRKFERWSHLEDTLLDLRKTLLEPYVEPNPTLPRQLDIVLPAEGAEGVAFTYRTDDLRSNRAPLDERIRGDQALPLLHAWELIASRLG